MNNKSTNKQVGIIMFLVAVWVVFSFYYMVHTFNDFSHQVDTKITNAINAYDERNFEPE